MILTRMSYARRAVIGVSGVIFVVATVGAGLLFGRAAFPSSSMASDGSAAPSPTPAATQASPQAPQREFVSFRDEEAGFTLSYPATWGPRSPSDEQVRFLGASPDGQNSALVRVTPFDREQALQQVRQEVDQEVTALDLNVRLTQQRVRSGDNVQEVLLGPEIVDLAGRRASYYVYSFTTEEGDQQGVHAQYFLFEQDRMVTLVLQAVPPSEFTRLAGTFDRIAQSFELLSPDGSGSGAGSPSESGSGAGS